MDMPEPAPYLLIPLGLVAASLVLGLLIAISPRRSTTKIMVLFDR